VPLSHEDVLLIVGRYDECCQSFEHLASSVHGVLAKVVGSRATRHMITHRAKSPTSLERKLWKDRDRYVAGDFDGSLSPPMKDLAAARVLLYLPADIDQIVDAVHDHFSSAGHTVVRKDKRRLDEYSAVHLQVTCDGSAMTVEGIPPTTVLEIQVCTIADHLWNELEHDIIYKQPSGEPDAAQQELLFVLRGELNLAASTANRLMRHTNELIAANTARIVNVEELQFALRVRANRALRGDFSALFDLLVGLVDPFSRAALHGCFETGRLEGDAQALLDELDVDGAQGDVGLIVLQLLPNFALAAIEAFVDSHEDPPPLFKFARRVAVAVHTRASKHE